MSAPATQPIVGDVPLIPTEDAQAVSAAQSLTPASPGVGNKRKHDDEAAAAAVLVVDPVTDYRDFGRKYCRLGELGFIPIFDVVEHGLKMEGEDIDEDDFVVVRTDAEKIADSCWGVLTNGIAGFRIAMVNAVQDRPLRRRICSRIMDTIQDQRSDDTGGLKYKILNYLNHDVSIHLSPPIANDDPHKAHRGWNHPVTARLLTPLEFDANDDTYANIKAGRKHATADQWPRFLYPDDCSYNSFDEEAGLFKGHLMIRVAKHIFTGPSSALKGPGYYRGRSNNARRIGMTAMTPQALAYVAVQARFAISDTEEWTRTDARDFDLHRFWCNVVGFFDDGEGMDVLDFYNRELFGPAAAPQSEPVRLTAVERIRAERAAKRARLDAA